MLPTEDLFTYVYVLVDDLITAGAIAIPPRPGPAPACSDAELLAIAIVRHLLSGRSEAGFLAEVARDWSHLFPIVPHQSEANRRIRWLWGAFEQFRRWLAGLLPADNRQQVDTSALPADSVLEPSCNRADLVMPYNNQFCGLRARMRGRAQLRPASGREGCW